MKKLFVSIPMKGRTEEQIKESIQHMKRIAEAYEGEELELIDSYIADKPPVNSKEAVWYLGESIKKLSEADVFIGIIDCWDWNGCSTENEIASRYGIKKYYVEPSIVIKNYRELLDNVRPVNEKLAVNC